MALKIWCHADYFPPATHELSIAAAQRVLESKGVTLDEVADAFIYIDAVCDDAETDYPAPAGQRKWEDAWYAAVRAAEAAAGVEPRRPLGSMLTLDTGDFRVARANGPDTLAQ